MAYGDFKDLPAASDKICAKVFNNSKNPKCDGYQKGLASMVYKVFDKKSSTTRKGTGINSDVLS